MNAEQRNALATAIARAVTVAVVEAIEGTTEPEPSPETMPTQTAVGMAPSATLRLNHEPQPLNPEPDADEDAAEQEIADMRLELELGSGFAPDEHKRAAMLRLLQLLDGGDVERVREMGRKFGLFHPESMAELAVPGPAAEATPEQRAVQEAFKAERVAREVEDGPARGEIIQIGDRSPMVGGWGRTLRPGASQRIAERHAE